MNIIDIFQSKLREYTNPSAHSEALIEEALHPQEPVIWKSKQGKGFKPVTWLMLAVAGLFFIGGILSSLGFGIRINGSIDSQEGWKLVGFSVLFGLIAIYIDRRKSAQSLYVVTDRRLLVCTAYDDDVLKVHELEIRPNTTTSYNKLTKVLTIDTPQPKEGLRDSLSNFLKSSSVFLENIDDQDEVTRLIQKIVNRQSGMEAQ